MRSGRTRCGSENTSSPSSRSRRDRTAGSSFLCAAPGVESIVVDVGLRGFVPLSQLVSIGAIDTHEPGVPVAVKVLVGKRLRVRVLEADPKRDRVILSEKAAVVDVGVADGLVHRSEITWEKGVDLIALWRLGDAVQVVVVSVDRDGQSISLSIKRLGADPWERYVNQLDTGQTVDATVTRVMPYGAFARVADGVEGLIHVSWPSIVSGGGCLCLLASRNAHETLSAERTPRVPNV